MSANLTDVVTSLERTPRIVAALAAGLDSVTAHANEGGDTFSTFDVVGHLIDGEETDWIPRALIIRAGGGPFEPFDRFRHIDRNRGRTLDSLVEEFSALRVDSLAEFASWTLTDTDLAATGLHPEFGDVTLRELLTTWAVHDLAHLAQITRVLRSRHLEHVGPWSAYFRS